MCLECRVAINMPTTVYQLCILWTNFFDMNSFVRVRLMCRWWVVVSLSDHLRTTVSMRIDTKKCWRSIQKTACIILRILSYASKVLFKRYCINVSSFAEKSPRQNFTCSWQKRVFCDQNNNIFDQLRARLGALRLFFVGDSHCTVEQKKCFPWLQFSYFFGSR